MSSRVINLDEQHFLTAEQKARALGKTPEQYVQGLIDADSKAFDEILQPARQGFENMADSELDDLLDRAQKNARRKLREQGQ